MQTLVLGILSSLYLYNLLCHVYVRLIIFLFQVLIFSLFQVLIFRLLCREICSYSFWSCLSWSSRTSLCCQVLVGCKSWSSSPSLCCLVLLGCKSWSSRTSLCCQVLVGCKSWSSSPSLVSKTQTFFFLFFFQSQVTQTHTMYGMAQSHVHHMLCFSGGPRR